MDMYPPYFRGLALASAQFFLNSPFIPVNNNLRRIVRKARTQIPINSPLNSKKRGTEGLKRLFRPHAEGEEPSARG